MKLKLYTSGKEKEVASFERVTTRYSSEYRRNMPYISKKRCTKLLNEMYPHFKADNVTLVAENPETNHTGLLNIRRNGTIVNY